MTATQLRGIDLDLTILGAAAINGLLIGGIYTLVASGLTLIYGVLHIINFAHGSMLMLAMFGVYYLLVKLGIDPYLSLLIMVPVMYFFGFCTCGLLPQKSKRACSMEIPSLFTD